MRLAALILGALLALPAAADVPPEPEGYRMDEYRAPVPETLEGATVIDDDAAYALWKTGRVGFVDVLAQPPKPADLPEDTLFREKPRHSIPGAIWLPNVGYGEIADETAAYFRAGMAHVTAGDLTAPVVLFCRSECWMSWNAGKRLQEWGYDRVFWYPGGTDGWEDRGYPTEIIERFDE